MARPIKDTTREDMIEQIKATARDQMTEKGTAGLSLRGIAREIGVTAPAIYNYFPTLDDLITTLITDAFRSIAAAMASAADAGDDGTAASRIFAAGIAYREWAVTNPIQFQLIYGNPIPNYSAPADITGPLARLPFEGLMRDFMRAYQSGELALPEQYIHLPDAVRADIQTYLEGIGFKMPEPLVYAIMSSWSHIHGIVMLELFDHITPILPHTGAFYRHEMAGFLRSLSMLPPAE
jgi:AcrR family transcriptional regulator